MLTRARTLSPRAIACAVIALAPVVTLAPCHAQARLDVTSLQPLAKLAIANGEAHGTFVGPLARMLQQRVRSDESILIDATALNDLPRAGCKRVKFDIHQANIIEPTPAHTDSAPHEGKLVFALKVCSDGSLYIPAAGSAPSPAEPAK